MNETLNSQVQYLKKKIPPDIYKFFLEKLPEANIDIV